MKWLRVCVYVYVCVDVVRSPNPGLPPTPGNSVAVVMLLLSLLWLFLSLALLFWLCSSGFARSVAPVAAVALFLAGFALYEYSRTSWGWDQLAANLAPWRCVCCMRHLMTGVATAGGSE